jgi:hypothetical protein
MADETPNPVVESQADDAPAKSLDTQASPPSITKKVDEGAVRTNLEKSVGDKLKALDFTNTEEGELKTEEKAPAEAGENDPKLAGIGEELDAEAEQPAEEDAEKPAPKTGPTLPSAVIRSLKAYDWDDASIASAMKADPANFTVAAQKIHGNRVAEQQRWADLGRAAKANQPKGETNLTASEAAAAKHIDAKTGLFRPLDVDALVEKHGNEDMVRSITEPVNEVIRQINALLPDLATGVSTIRQSRHETLARQVDQFFEQKELEPFQKVYGKDSAAMDTEQTQARNKVLEMADALMAGAAQQGRKLTVTDAMTMAHDHVSSGFKQETTRREIKASVTVRNKGLTLKPSTNGTKSTGAPKSGAELESRTRQRLAAVFDS